MLANMPLLRLCTRHGTQTLMAMRERLAGLVNRRSAREEETDEKLKETSAALQAAYRERQVPVLRARHLAANLAMWRRQCRCGCVRCTT